MQTTILYIKLGWRCNEKCIFCAVGTDQGPAELPYERVLDQLRIGREYGATILTISGGEPTVRRDLIDIVSAAKKLGYSSINLQSNGRAFNSGSYSQRLVDAGLSKSIVSVHGPNAEIHDGITLVRGGFIQTIHGILEMLNRGGPNTIRTNTTIIKSNLPHVPNILSLLEGLGVRQMNFSFVQPSGSARSVMPSLAPKMTDTVEVIVAAIQRKQPETRLTVDGIPTCLFPKKYWLLSHNQLYPLATFLGREGDWHVYEVMTAYSTNLAGHATHYPRVLKIVPSELSISEEEEVEGLVYATSCQQCEIRPQCPGLWSYYPEMYGLDEFQKEGAYRLN